MTDLPLLMELLLNSDLVLKIDGKDRPDTIMLGEFIPKGPFALIGPGNGKPLDFSYERNNGNLGLPSRVRVYSMGLKYDSGNECPITHANIECVLPNRKYLMNFMIYQQSGSLPKKDFIAYSSASSDELQKERDKIMNIARSNNNEYIEYLTDLVQRLERRQ
jgi:hypothetical protein